MTSIIAENKNGTWYNTWCKQRNIIVNDTFRNERDDVWDEYYESICQSGQSYCEFRDIYKNEKLNLAWNYNNDKLTKELGEIMREKRFLEKA